MITFSAGATLSERLALAAHAIIIVLYIVVACVASTLYLRRSDLLLLKSFRKAVEVRRRAKAEQRQRPTGFQQPLREGSINHPYNNSSSTNTATALDVVHVEERGALVDDFGTAVKNSSGHYGLGLGGLGMNSAEFYNKNTANIIATLRRQQADEGGGNQNNSSIVGAVVGAMPNSGSSSKGRAIRQYATASSTAAAATPQQSLHSTLNSGNSSTAHVAMRSHRSSHNNTISDANVVSDCPPPLQPTRHLPHSAGGERAALLGGDLRANEIVESESDGEDAARNANHSDDDDGASSSASSKSYRSDRSDTDAANGPSQNQQPRAAATTDAPRGSGNGSHQEGGQQQKQHGLPKTEDEKGRRGKRGRKTRGRRRRKVYWGPLPAHGSPSQYVDTSSPLYGSAQGVDPAYSPGAKLFIHDSVCRFFIFLVFFLVMRAAFNLAMIFLQQRSVFLHESDRDGGKFGRGAFTSHDNRCEQNQFLALPTFLFYCAPMVLLHTYASIIARAEHTSVAQHVTLLLAGLLCVVWWGAVGLMSLYDDADILEITGMCFSIFYAVAYIVAFVYFPRKLRPYGDELRRTRRRIKSSSAIFAAFFIFRALIVTPRAQDGLVKSMTVEWYLVGYMLSDLIPIVLTIYFLHSRADEARRAVSLATGSRHSHVYHPEVSYDESESEGGAAGGDEGPRVIGDGDGGGTRTVGGIGLPTSYNSNYHAANNPRHSYYYSQQQQHQQPSPRLSTQHPHDLPPPLRAQARPGLKGSATPSPHTPLRQMPTGRAPVSPLYHDRDKDLLLRMAANDYRSSRPTRISDPPPFERTSATSFSSKGTEQSMQTHNNDPHTPPQ